MIYVLLPQEEIGPERRVELGGKAASLYSARNAGAIIPEWFAVTPRAFLDSAQGGDAVLPTADVVREIERVLDRLGFRDALLAVRSSAADEDGHMHSFAGQFESFLFVRACDVPEKLGAVWRHATSPHITAYRSRHGIAGRQTAPAVIVQRMVHADASGIAFSADPVSGQRDLCMIDAVDGLCAELASGRRDGSTFHVDSAGGIVRRTGAAQSATLTDEQILSVAVLARRMEAHFGCPQDIEWAFEKGTLYLLQSRPITALKPHARNAGDTTRLWDNSNIIESYSGITTPLTFSFARIAYAGVYRQFVRIMGVPKARIAANDLVFETMLGLIRGRIYYNLLNWYRLLRMLPGFSINRGFMEQMMGVRRALPDDLAAQLAGEGDGSWRAKAADVLALAVSLVAMARNRLRLRRNITAFYARLEDALADPVPPLSERSLEGLVQHYRRIEAKLLRRWDAPLINDLFCMIAFGLLGNLLRSVSGADAAALRNALLTGAGGMISAEPLERVRAMAVMAAKDAKLVRALSEGTRVEALTALMERPEIDRLYREYLERFGDRCFGELKLESPTLREDPMPLLRAIGAGTTPVSGRREDASPLDALSLQLRGRPIRSWLIRRMTAEARARIRDRENLRFERTRVFGRAREAFRQIGIRLHECDAIENPRDVLYLEVPEILGFVEGTATSTKLGDLVRLRRVEFESLREAPPPRLMTRGAVGQARIIAAEAHHAGDRAGEERQGIGCCAGIVRGLARVVKDPSNATLRQGEILVAEFTDPGWVTLFSRAAGVLVERGSPLSHSATVAREMGIPAVVSLHGITDWLQDGDEVEMDGGTGRVRKIQVAARGGSVAA